MKKAEIAAAKLGVQGTTTHTTSFKLQDPSSSNLKAENSEFYKQVTSDTGVEQRFIMPRENLMPTWGNSKFPRSEAAGNMEWAKGDGLHAFEATYQVHTKDEVCIMQVFASDAPHEGKELHPIAMLQMRLNGLSARSYCYPLEASEKGWIDEKLIGGPEMIGKPFEVIVFDDGSTTNIFLNGALVFKSKPCPERQAGRNVFKWGSYGPSITEVVVKNPIQIAFKKS